MAGIDDGFADAEPSVHDLRVEEMLAVYDAQAAALRKTALGLYGTRLRSLKQAPNPVEQIVSDSALQSHFQSMYKQVKKRVRALVRPPYLLPIDVEAELEGRLLESAVKVQVIMGPDLLDNAELLAATMEAIKAGEETRILPVVPMKMMMIDDECAIIAVPEHGSAVHLFVRRSPLLDGLIAVFDALWNVATPLPQSISPSARGNERVAVDRAVLTLLAAGATDAAIARHLDISVRTAQRRISDIMSALGVGTRFQAGVQAARHGWL
jgi:DNA-binding CsgD family transcriptional regulator